jgi:hypothetical protein
VREEKLEAALPNAPRITSGEVLVTETREPAAVWPSPKRTLSARAPAVAGLLVPLAAEDLQQIAHLLTAGERVWEREMRPERVMATPPPSLACEIAGRLELVDDAVNRTFGDSDLVADLAQPNARVARDAPEHLRVVRQERPWWALAYRHKH